MSLFKLGETARHRARVEEAAADAMSCLDRLEQLLAAVQSAVDRQMAAADSARAADAARLDETFASTDRQIRDLCSGVAALDTRVATLDTRVAALEAQADAGAATSLAFPETVRQLLATELDRRDAQLVELGYLRSIRSWSKESRHMAKESSDKVDGLTGSIAGLEQRIAAQTATTEVLPSLVAALGKLQTRVATEFRELRKLRNPLGAPDDEQFLEIVEPLLESRRTMLGYDRLFVLWQSVRNVAHLRSAAAEIGSFRGGSAYFLAQALQATTGGDRELHVVDTFEGHPDDKITTHDSEQQRGKFTETSFEEVQEYLSPFAGVRVHKGEAGTVLPRWPEMPFALVHIDLDLYEPTLECLRYFGPRLEPGGIIVMDDYGAPSCPGVAFAVTEFLAGTTSFTTWQTHTEQLVLVKR